MFLLIFYVVLALAVSFLCSIMEAVMLSVTPSYVAHVSAGDSLLGRKLAEMKKDVDRPLAAILSLNTIAHTVGAAGAGAQATIVFGSASVGIASGILTFLILVFSEIIPKTLGALYWRTLAPSVVRLLVPTIWLMWPLVKLAEGLTLLLSRNRNETTVRREELAALTEIGAREGVLQEDESRMMRSLFRFGTLTAADVMTPRTVVFALSSKATVGETMADHPEMPFSRILVFGSDIDHVEGFVLKNEILLSASRGETDAALTSMMRPITAVPQSVTLRQLFDRMVRNQEHIVLVVDEYGGTVGLVTLEDILETLLDLEIIDEADTVEDMRQFARTRWEKRRAERFKGHSTPTKRRDQ
jgi:CBS domain containing-hemolysin-like protein